MGLGYWTRSNSEICLLGTRGHPSRVSRSISQVCDARIMEHSKKPDGKGLAALTPTIIEASYQGAPEKFAKLAKLFGGEKAEDLAGKVRELLEDIELTCTLSDLGIEEKDIPWMAENCMKVSAPSIANNPVVFSQEEIAEIYKKAL